MNVLRHALSSSAFRAPVAAVLAAALLSVAAPASARNLSYSVGGGVKCYYVLTSSADGVNVWQTVCYKSGV